MSKHMLNMLCNFQVGADESKMKHWINTVTRDHVLIGKEGGFVQSGHGKETPLKKMLKAT